MISQIREFSSSIEEEISSRCSGLMKPFREGISNFVSCMLSERTANLMMLATALPRNIGDNEHRYQYLARILKHNSIDISDVMEGFIVDVLMDAAKKGETAILMVDQSKIKDGFECLMLSLRVENRAVPLLWKVVETKGAIGWDECKPLLDRFAEIMPLGIKYCLMADRFYGHQSLIGWCQNWGFSYRIRLKNNLILEHEGGEITTGEACKLGLKSLENAKLGDVYTNIGILHEQGHKEPWIIAMNDKPTKGRVLDYGMRWGIENMFSDFKSRGFGITKTKLIHADRIEKLILVMAIALIIAVYTGMKFAKDIKKNSPLPQIKLHHWHANHC